MRDENPGGAIVGLIGLLLYGIYLAVVFIVKFIIAHIWWFVVILGIALIVFFLIRYFRKNKLDKEKIKNWIIKNKRPLLYVGASGLVLFLFRSNFWTVFVTLGVIWIVLFIVNRFINEFYGCKVCDATGKLSGYNAHLDIEFKDDQCYACGGKHLILEGKSDWYNIAVKAGKTIEQLQQNILLIERDFSHYSSEVKIGRNVQEEKVLYSDTLKKQKFMGIRKTHEASITLHKEIEKKAHIFLHIYHISEQHKKWDHILDRWDDKTQKVLEDGLTMAEEVEVAQKFNSEIVALEYLLESESAANISDELRLDIEKATGKIKLLFEKRA